MKKIFFIFSLIIACMSASAQVPHAINFQGVLYDTNGKVIPNDSITYLKVSILEGNTVLFVGDTTIITNPVGAFSHIISQNSLDHFGGTLGNFNLIQWNSGLPKTLKIDIASSGVPASATNYATIPLVSVPYSFASKTLEGADFTNATNGQVLTYDAATQIWKAQSLGSGLTQGNGILISSNTISVNLVSGTGIGITGGNTIVNTAPDVPNQSFTYTPLSGALTITDAGSKTVNIPVTKAPTNTIFLSGTGTFTTSTNPSPLYIKIKMVGGGGGGESVSGTNGGNGGNTVFGPMTANGGAGGTGAGISLGGTASLGVGPVGLAISGGSGSSSDVSLNYGGAGGNSALGGGGGSGTTTGGAGAANTGGGGGGANNATSAGGGAGGGAGGYIEAIITNPATSYSYTVGAGGTGGGATGGSGVIIIEEYYH